MGMIEKNTAKLPIEPYKGVRDFYPEDMAVQNYIFSVWRDVAQKFGYQEYGASILELAEIYRSKGNDEIVNEQMFTFTDRGGREVALRPEMTPSLARMIAARRKSLKFPLRWFSIPNVFRYERPQRGRRREHWQLNCDLMGIADTSAEVEIIELAYKIMKEFGAKDEDFEIRINSRKIINYILQTFLNLDEGIAKKVANLIDRKQKMPAKDWQIATGLLIDEKSIELDKLLNAKSFDEFTSYLSKEKTVNKTLTEFQAVMESVKKLGITDIMFDPTITRGFDYYTGMVFEVFDTHPDNRRSLFGGGRYDNLLEIFGAEPIPTVGFGMGDITIRDFLETHGLPIGPKK